MLRPGTLYFAYGCHLDPDHLGRVIGSGPPDGWPARLDGWRLAFSVPENGQRVATLIEARRCRTYGAVYRVSREGMDALDRYENVPHLYRRATVWVEPLDRPARQAAVVYLARAERTAEEGPPGDDYLRRILAGVDAHGLPADYGAWVSALARGRADGCYGRGEGRTARVPERG